MKPMAASAAFGVVALTLCCLSFRHDGLLVGVNGFSFTTSPSPSSITRRISQRTNSYHDTDDGGRMLVQLDASASSSSSSKGGRLGGSFPKSLETPTTASTTPVVNTYREPSTSKPQIPQTTTIQGPRIEQVLVKQDAFSPVYMSRATPPWRPMMMMMSPWHFTNRNWCSSGRASSFWCSRTPSIRSRHFRRQHLGPDIISMITRLQQQQQQMLEWTMSGSSMMNAVDHEDDEMYQEPPAAPVSLVSSFPSERRAIRRRLKQEWKQRKQELKHAMKSHWKQLKQEWKDKRQQDKLHLPKKKTKTKDYALAATTTTTTSPDQHSRLFWWSAAAVVGFCWCNQAWVRAAALLYAGSYWMRHRPTTSTTLLPEATTTMDPSNRPQGTTTAAVDSSNAGGVTLVQLSVVLQIPNRDDNDSILQRLQHIASQSTTAALTQDRSGLQRLTQMVALELLRRTSSMVRAGGGMQYHHDPMQAQYDYEKRVIQERAKVQEETIHQYGGLDLSSSSFKRSKHDNAMNQKINGRRPTLAVVTMILAFTGNALMQQQQLMPTTTIRNIRSRRDLEEVLSSVAAQAKVGDALESCEILWTPTDPNESLTMADIVADHPNLRVL